MLAPKCKADFAFVLHAYEQIDIAVRYEDENIWLSQKMMASLYQVETHTINYHLKKAFEDNEIDENSVIRNFRITAADGKT